ncbi:hypothetical protein SteCoe_13 [Stentor coeruleus]|uniref:Amidohydrolase-related domain-containing protein n=1 Tax=Stentor coeruleus TaxID=5963 RepID=A0A1R2D4V5_9CILI|nr:hypothetical protein SteCoe_13 [Stentor coeruleus]
MTTQKLALISRRIICEDHPMPIHGAILIKDDTIENIIPISDIKHEILAQEYILEDLGSLCIFPGLVDLNVSFSSDGASTVTRQALSGGVTTLATTDPLEGELFTDIASVRIISDSTLKSIKKPEHENIFAYKGYLVPQGPNPETLKDVTKALEVCQDLPLIIHPELTTPEKMMQATPFRQVAPEKRIFNCKIVITEEKQVYASEFRLNSDDEPEEFSESFEDDISGSESCSEDNPDIRINDFDNEESTSKIMVQGFNSMCLNVPEREKKRVSLPTLLGVENILVPPTVPSPRHNSVQCIGINSRPIPLQDIPFIKKGIQVEQAYHEHISKFPVDWEVAAVKKVLEIESKAQVHFCNVCSSEAVETINQLKINKEHLKVTCETSLPYVYFTETDVKPGDTRYKINPPIRDLGNFRNLWQMVKNQQIDCISSYHQPVNPPLKFIGDFSRAVNGVTSVGFTLQCIWTKLRTQIPMEEESGFLSLISLILSNNPAKVLNLKNKGGIKKGKHADFVVWDPESKIKITSTFDKFPHMSPLMGEELYGVIHRTYLRGTLVYSNNRIISKGSVLKRF